MWAFVGVLVIFALLLLFVEPANAAEVEPFVALNHTSDLLRGCPFDCGTEEVQVDYFAPLAMTITAGKRRAWEIDLSHGFKWIERGPRESGSQLAVRFYYRRIRFH